MHLPLRQGSPSVVQNGSNDYTLQFDAYKFFDRLSLQGTAGYRLRGDPPGVELDDVLIASVGGAYLASSDTLVGMYFDYRQSSISGADDIHSSPRSTWVMPMRWSSTTQANW